MSRFIIVAIICLVLILAFYFTIWRTWFSTSPKKEIVKPQQAGDKEKKQSEESESSTDGKE